MPLNANAARGLLVIARAALEQSPDTPLEELAKQLAGSLGGKRTEIRQTLLDAGLFAAAVPLVSVATPEAATTAEPEGPRYQLGLDDSYRGHEVSVYDMRPPPDQRPLIPGNRGGHLIFRTNPLRAQALADGLNLGMPYLEAQHRAIAVQHVCGGGGAAVPSWALEWPEGSAFVCELQDDRAWGPFASAAEADDFRRTRGDRLWLWAITTTWPFWPLHSPTEEDSNDSDEL